MRDYVILDVFTTVPLQGNQLAVFTDARGLDEATMQLAARELNLSETVFLLPGEAGTDAQIRIFTPGTELPFAGHPVLGAAYVVGARSGGDQVSLGTGAGVVTVDLTRSPADGGEIVFGEMAQPIPTVAPFEHDAELLAALGVPRSELPIEVYVNGPRHVMVTLGGEPAVAALEPNLNAVAELGELNVSCFAGSGSRWKTRMFAPGVGVHEDPATGSAAGPLALHLARHGRIGFGDWIEIRQGAEIGRPSLLHACASGSADQIGRVAVGGSAVRVAQGQYLIER